MSTTTGTTVHRCGTREVTPASATRIGGRSANADAASTEGSERGIGAAVVDGIGSRPAVVSAARRAADVAAIVASHRGAQVGLLAACDTMPDVADGPNAVAAAVSLEPGGRIEIAHCGDAAVWTWSTTAGLRRWTVDQTVGEHVAHLLRGRTVTPGNRDALDRVGDAVQVLDDYVLNGLKFAGVSTISWTPLRGADADVDLILLTSDGVHKPLSTSQILDLARLHHGDAHALADALVDVGSSAPRTDPDECADNATAAVIALGR